MSRTDEKMNLLDFLQLIWFDFRIKLAEKRNERAVFSNTKVREKVIKRIKDVGYNVYTYTSGQTVIIMW